MAQIVDMEEERRARAAGVPALNRGDGDGTSGGMEARVAKLEAHMEHVRDELRKLASVPADIAGMKSDIANLPTKEYLGQLFDRQFRWITGLIILIAALVGLVLKLT